MSTSSHDGRSHHDKLHKDGLQSVPTTSKLSDMLIDINTPLEDSRAGSRHDDNEFRLVQNTPRPAIYVLPLCRPPLLHAYKLLKSSAPNRHTSRLQHSLLAGFPTSSRIPFELLAPVSRHRPPTSALPRYSPLMLKIPCSTVRTGLYLVRWSVRPSGHTYTIHITFIPYHLYPVMRPILARV
ncbi:hypothetical protein C8Q74DRAFT_342890 [Fomes fomentarius]|nr:hypothetical protein C8Q74DRAFT_342890 [Fomes fomentarius]